MQPRGCLSIFSPSYFRDEIPSAVHITCISSIVQKVYRMITTAEVISALTYPEDAFTCIASIASTRCMEIIQLNRHERFENVKALALTDNLKLLRRRLDQVIRLVLCDAHRKENVVQENIRRWGED